MGTIEAQAASPCALLDPASYATTSAASGNYTSVREFEGDIMVVQCVSTGASMNGGVLHASDVDGTSEAVVMFNEGEFTDVSGASGNIQLRTVSANSIGPYVKYAATLTGASLIAVSLIGQPKYL